MQVFLIPFAGGNRYSYDFLIRRINQKELETISLELPGRGKRHNEADIHILNEAIEDYLRQIVTLRNDTPFIIYGHSLGAILGYYVTRRIESLGDFPTALIVSGNPGPEIKDNKQLILTDEALKDKLRNLGGISEEILKNEEVFEFFKTSIKADFNILHDEQNSQNAAGRINTPIYALMGDSEENVDHIESWKHFTSSKFTYKIFPGNHFFIHQHPDEIAQVLSANLKKALSSGYKEF
jgi:external thioesterase TEII